MPLGSLRDQVLYPERGRTLTDAELAALLERVNLGSILDRLGGPLAEHDWAKVLSTGEQQRLAFARVLLARPRYAMLDEATSALDTETERAIQASLADLARGRTTLVIAHRLATIRDADRILVVADGGIAEEGTHATLLARGGLYRRLHQAQFGGQAAE